MRRCEFCHLPLPADSKQARRFCDHDCSRDAALGNYSPPLVPLSKRFSDPIWGPLADLWRRKET